MSNRSRTLAYAFIAAVALVSGIVLTGLPLARPPVLPSRIDSSFRTVNDRPVVESLSRYYELVHKGKTTVTVDGVDYTIFWQDFSTEEKQKLGLMLRVP